MKEDRDIPQSEQSWLKAEQMLSSHFRRKRIIFWLLYVALPVILIGIAGLLYIQKPELNISENVAQVNSAATANDKIVSADKKLIGNNDVSEDKVFSSENSKNHKFSKSNDLKSTPIQVQESLADVKSQNSYNYPDHVFSSKVSTSKFHSAESASLPAVDKKAPVSKKNSEANNIFTENNLIDKPATRNDNSSFLNLEKRNQPSPEASMVPEISFLQPVSPDLNTDNYLNYNLSERISDNNKDNYYSQIGWEISLYGAGSYVSKNISTKNQELNNYISQRNLEEESVLMPSLGLSLSANIRSWSVSLGLEYASVGERTRYYPYSNKDVISEIGNWNVYTTTSVDIDTAYITGNPYFLQTVMQRQDSSFVFTNDTITQFGYDNEIEKRNGINRISYFEIPLEVSYYLTKGKAGIGLSGGLSAGFLSGSKGYYLRSDGKGLMDMQKIDYYREFMLNARFGVDFYYRTSARTKINLRPQFRTNLNSVFSNESEVKQKYFSTGIVFGVSYMIN